MTILKRIICFILKIIEEILMNIIPKICGKNFLHITSFCDDMDRFIGADDITIIQGTDFDPTSGVTAVDSEGNILPFTVTPSELPSLCTLGTTTFTYQTETFLKQREVTVVQAPLPTITLPTASVTCDSEVCDAQTDPNTIGVGETLNTMTGVSATDAHGNTLAVTCLEGSSVVYTTGGLKLLHYTATDECGNVGTATRAITVLAGNWSGIGNVTINQGTSFSPTDGVHAYDYQGNEVPFTATPSTVDTCDVGTTTLTYSASGLADATRTVTVNAISNPAIFGVPSTTLEVEVGDTFDPLDGVTAYDGNGNAVAVTVNLEKPNLFVGRPRAQGGGAYGVVIQDALSYKSTAKTYVATTNIPHALPWNIMLNMLGESQEISSDAPLRFTVPANTQVAVLLTWAEQEVTEGTFVNVAQAIDNDTYWVRIEEA